MDPRLNTVVEDPDEKLQGHRLMRYIRHSYLI